jgi:predicted phosphodiesterase
MDFRLLVMSDIHANLPALEAVLENAEKHGPYDAMLSAGDQIGYGPHPQEVVQLLREKGVTCIKGNHEVDLLHGSNSWPRFTKNVTACFCCFTV